MSMGGDSGPTTEAEFVQKVREQIRILRSGGYNYTELHVYVSGIAEAWVFGPHHEFDLDSEEVLVVREGPTEEHDNEAVPEWVIPYR